eukprot:GGOE01053995.1.p1 GENE.GGOE01053995.1~~GGOE01053995.1.p1  ORF type:complete len:203 (+),score=72.44 GGOE01053995.1:90-698(+)
MASRDSERPCLSASLPRPQSPGSELTREDVSAFFPRVPELMEFESWWMEGGQKRYLLALYHPAHAAFEILLDTSDAPLRVAIFNRNNQPLRAWDLYVGVVVDVLGKPTTLQRASSATSAWLDANAKRLWKRRQWLEDELRKFTQVPPLQHMEVTIPKALREGTGFGPIGGTTHLARLAQLVLFLTRCLQQYKEVPLIPLGWK